MSTPAQNIAAALQANAPAAEALATTAGILAGQPEVGIAATAAITLGVAMANAYAAKQAAGAAPVTAEEWAAMAAELDADLKAYAAA